MTDTNTYHRKAAQFLIALAADSLLDCHYRKHSLTFKINEMAVNRLIFIHNQLSKGHRKCRSSSKA